MFEKFSQAVAWIMTWIVGSAVQRLQVAAARYDTATRREALAEAQRLKASNDPGERALGEQLEARILQVQPPSADFVLDASDANGVDLGPLSVRSSQALPGATSSLPALQQPEQPQRRGPGRPRKNPAPEANHQPEQIPPRRGPGRPRKAEANHQPEQSPPNPGPGRPRSS